jgi:hypothetical protein
MLPWSFLKPDGDAQEGLFDAWLIHHALCKDVGVGAVGRVPPYP